MFDPLTPLETVVLRDETADATVALAPSRGGIVTRFFVGDRPVLYLDESTLLDPSKNIRGGVPVLFPSPGALEGGRFRHGGTAGAMKQHGFARQRAWAVGRQDESSVTLTLESDEVTRAQFPWDFALRFRYWLEGTRLHITQHVENRSASAMPFAMGFHPYFFVPDGEKAKTSIATTATRAFDNTTKTDRPLAGPIDLTLAEVDLHLDEHATLRLPDGYRVVVSASPEFRRWVLWTLRSRDFVCLEPWTAAGDALNTGDGLIVLPPGHSHELWTEIALVAP